MKYRLEVLAVSLKFRLQRMGMAKFGIFAGDVAPVHRDYYEQVE